MQSSEYDRGHTDARMSNYDAHFERLNGSMDRNANAIERLTIAVQQLRDQHSADAATRIATAAALKDASDALRDKADGRWSPVAKFITVGSFVLLVTGMIITVLVTKI